MSENLDHIGPAEMLTEINREIAMRERVYPAWVRNGKLTQIQSDNRIRTMRAVALHLERAVNAGKAGASGDLFGGAK